MQSSVLVSTRKPKHLSHAMVYQRRSVFSEPATKTPSYANVRASSWARLSFNQGKQNAIFAGKRASRSYRFEVGKK